ncbi:hypothetical protein CEXT_227541 [Caerostris extrusa]|uniref:Transmembrane protein n=1 Tax=Caerostris extrusa TaxID=172846 RepID=A0AAV4WN72_CAEEX|nr:hypothetical protein CEXT_227541 [Caerostris extrusa]
MVQEMRDDTDWKENRLRSLTISECSSSISLTFLILVGQLSFGSSFSFQGWSPPPVLVALFFVSDTVAHKNDLGRIRGWVGFDRTFVAGSSLPTLHHPCRFRKRYY